MSETEVIDATGVEVLDGLPRDTNGTQLVVREDGSIGSSIRAAPVDMGVLRDMGFITPIATPEMLRAAFAYKQQMYAAILDESDYLYSVAWQSDNKQVQKVTNNYGDAKTLAEKFAHLGAQLTAKPKKSGIVKLARALGITARRKMVKGLPEDPTASFSYVEYEATHEGTSTQETGVGWCDKGERGGRMSLHDVIATADTRAYNRAVLRLSGFGDVSADEIVVGASEGQDLPVDVPQSPRSKETAPLPDASDDDVVTANRAWAEAMAKRNGVEAPAAKQDTRSAREMRAQARRGNARVAMQMGALGLGWKGTASDGLGCQPFEVAAPSLGWEAFVKPEPAPEAAPAESKGWELSNGDDDDASDTAVFPDLAAAPKGGGSKSSAGVPQPSPTAETVTTKQAKNVSALLKSIFSTPVEMKAWLREECGVDSSIHLRMNQYESAMSYLKKQSEQKESSNG